LLLWKDDGRIVAQLKKYNSQIVPIIFTALCQTAERHWHKNVKSLAKEVQNILVEWNWKLWNHLSAGERDQSPVNFTFYQTQQRVERERMASIYIEYVQKERKKKD